MKTVFVAGASGLVGSALLGQLLNDASVGTIYAAVRKPLLVQNPRLHTLPLDADLAGLSIDEAYICLGTTLKAAGSQAAFRAIDVDLVCQLAKRLRTAGLQRCAVVSSLGASPKGGFYLRCKAEMEAALLAMGFERLVFLRPSFLTGQRSELRVGERLALALAALVRPLIPKKYRPVAAERVAAAMQAALAQGKGALVVENAAIG